jgi:hypothetical protein
MVFPFLLLKECLRKHHEIEALLLQFQVCDMGLKYLGIKAQPTNALYADLLGMLQPSRIDSPRR